MVAKRAVLSDSANLFKRVSGGALSQLYRHKQGIFTQGEKANTLFYVLHGHVKLTVTGRTGKKAVIQVLRGGDFFGEECLRGSSKRGSTASAIHDSEVCSISGESFAALLQSDPPFAKLFIAHLLSRIARMEEQLVDQIFSSSERRLARILLLLAGISNGSQSEPVLLKVTQTTLAEMVGTTRSRISFFMNRFRDMKLIDYNGHLHVNKALVAFLLHD
jgi:CRP/FNR family transcriptional regulator, cyclic AMP receptor protein